MKNLFGMKSHPTDGYIHWSEQKKDVVAIKLRTAYDAIHKAGLIEELDILMQASYDKGTEDVYEGYAGADL
jgi:hypothetical protein